MVTIKKNQLIIELEHSAPEEFLLDLQEALIIGLRTLCADAARDVPSLDGKQLCDAAIPMLDVLEAIIPNTSTLK
jgi:hypothetical protein